MSHSNQTTPFEGLQAALPSLQHTGRRAKREIKHLVSALNSADFQSTYNAVTAAISAADDCCAAAGFTLKELLDDQPFLKGAPKSLVRLPPNYTKQFEEACNAAKTKQTRATNRSFVKHSVLLLRITLTIKAYDCVIGLGPLLKAMHAGLLGVSPAGRQDVDPLPVGEIAAGKAARDQRHISNSAIFRAVLKDLPPWKPLGPNNFSIPGWDRAAPSLPQLRDLFDAVLGPMARNAAAREWIVPAEPSFVDCDEAFAALSPDVSEALRTASVLTVSNQPTGKLPDIFFPQPLWKQALPPQGTLLDWSAAAASVVRTRATFKSTSCTVAPTFFGKLKQLQVSVANGASSLILGMAGTGKSQLLAMLDFGSRTVFEIGASTRGRNSYLLCDFDRLLQDASRTPGARTLIVHAMVLVPEQLCALGIFDQILIAGDPRQPTPPGGVDHIDDFMKRIEATTVVLPTVWRSRNTSRFAFNNFVAYGSQFTALRPWNLFTKHPNVNERDNAINVISCIDAAGSVAATMLAHAVGKCGTGRSVLIGTDNPEVIAALDGQLQLLPEIPKGLMCCYLNDLQGRSADVVIIDVLEVAAHVPDVDDALRSWLMISGCARATLSLIVRQKQSIEARPDPLPFLACVATALCWTIRSMPHEDPRLGDLASAVASVDKSFGVETLDEQSLAVTWGPIALFVVVRDKTRFNVPALQRRSAVVEIPDLFGESDNRANVVAEIARMLAGPVIRTPPRFTTLSDLAKVWIDARQRLADRRQS